MHLELLIIAHYDGNKLWFNSFISSIVKLQNSGKLNLDLEISMKKEQTIVPHKPKQQKQIKTELLLDNILAYMKTLQLYQP